MKKSVLLLTMVLFFTSCKTLGELGLKPSHLETVFALQKILDSSTFKAIKTLKSLADGGDDFLPKEVNTVLASLKTLGYGEQIYDIKSKIESVSKIALKESEGVLGEAVKQLKFTDAVAVVLGGEDAATNVLKRAMYDTVKSRYSDEIERELDKTDVSDYWPLASNTYNLFAKNKVDSSLSDFLAERAVDAIFIAIGKEEAKARTDYKAIGDNVVNKVFDYYQNKN